MQKLPEEVVTYADWECMCVGITTNLFVLYGLGVEPLHAIKLAQKVDALTQGVMDDFFGKGVQRSSSELPDEGLVPDYFVGQLMEIKARYYDPYVP